MIYLWECKTCGARTETEQSIKEDVMPPDYSCPSCQSAEYVRVFEMPGVTRRSFLDGQRKDRDWTEMKRAAQLEVQKARSTDTEERAALQKDITRLRTPRK